jgi:hypothetical protein
MAITGKTLATPHSGYRIQDKIGQGLSDAPLINPVRRMEMK